MKRIIQITAFILFALALSGLMGFIYLEREMQELDDINVRVCRDSEKGFINKDEIYTLIESTDSIRNRKFKEINTRKLEQIISENPYVQNTDVFVNINNRLIVNVKEKSVVLRVFNQNSNGYYIDENAGILPLSNQFTPRILIANGYINTPHIKNHDNIYDSIYTSPTANKTVLSDLFTLTNIICNDKFLQAQISQIYVNSKGEYDLIPQIGNQIIHLGSIDNAENKLAKLEIFYKEAMMKSGWEKYKIINLKFKNQVVCTKK